MNTNQQINPPQQTLATPYILDLFTEGSKLLFAIKELFPYRVNHWSNVAEYNETVKKVYIELVIQVLLAMSDEDELQVMYNIAALPDYTSLRNNAIYQVDMPEYKNQFEQAVKSFALFLKGEIDHKVNPSSDRKVCDYQLDALTEYMVIVAKHVR